MTPTQICVVVGFGIAVVVLVWMLRSKKEVGVVRRKGPPPAKTGVLRPKCGKPPVLVAHAAVPGPGELQRMNGDYGMRLIALPEDDPLSSVADAWELIPLDDEDGIDWTTAEVIPLYDENEVLDELWAMDHPDLFTDGDD